MGRKYCGRIYKWTIKRSGKDTEILQEPISLGMGGVEETAFQSDRKS